MTPKKKHRIRFSYMTATANFVVDLAWDGWNLPAVITVLGALGTGIGLLRAFGVI